MIAGLELISLSKTIARNRIVCQDKQLAICCIPFFFLHLPQTATVSRMPIEWRMGDNTKGG